MVDFNNTYSISFLTSTTHGEFDNTPVIDIQVDSGEGLEGTWMGQGGEDEDYEDMLIDPRADDEHKCANDYWGMLHNIAYNTSRKMPDVPEHTSKALFRALRTELDKAETYYIPGVSRGLPAPVWYKLTGGEWVEGKWVMDPMSFRSRLNRYRYALKAITYEQWAYLQNYLNVLVNSKDKDTGETKQWPSMFQNIKVEEIINPEDIAMEIIEVYYTKD